MFIECARLIPLQTSQQADIESIIISLFAIACQYTVHQYSSIHHHFSLILSQLYWYWLQLHVNRKKHQVEESEERTTERRSCKTRSFAFEIASFRQGTNLNICRTFHHRHYPSVQHHDAPTIQSNISKPSPSTLFYSTLCSELLIHPSSHNPRIQIADRRPNQSP